jgi:three-Cys-motif partner protein
MPREVGTWTQDKLKILARYLPGYLQATTSALERIYIDGFAGPGTNTIRGSGKIIDGSPLIALKARAMNNPTAFSRLYFIDSDRDTLNELEDTVASRGLGGRATFVHGDVNAHLPRVVRQLPRRSPTFVFLDPAGIDPQWSTIEAIAPWRTELLINFPFGMAIKRNLTSPKVTEYFGTDEWRTLWQSSGRGRTRAILDLYKERLRGLGYEHTIPNDLVVRAGGNRRLYYLLFATKAEIAPGIMNWVFGQPDAAGQMKMPLPENDPGS